MKRSLLISAIAIAAYYLIRQLLGNNDEGTVAPPRKHLTDAFARAKEHAVAATE